MRRARRLARAACLAALVLAAAACRPTHTADAPAAPPPTASAEALEQGRRIYNFRCYYCHGYSGDARTLAASFLSPAPRNFQALSPDELPRDAMLRAVAEGVAGTAMASFRATLSAAEIERVVDFVRAEFVVAKARNTAYHTAGNGWPGHERYRAAYPFATGEIPMDRPWDALDAAQTAGKRLYLSACVSCHDRGRVTREDSPWEIRGVSYPPGNYEEEEHHEAPAQARRESASTGAPSAAAAIDPYELHEIPRKLAGAGPLERRGEAIFQRNCAHCHAADGTGRNWIGSFLDPHPPDFSSADVAARLTRDRAGRVTRDGVPGSSMPAWRSVLAQRDIDAVAAYVERVFGPNRAK
jgi:cytochrome c oxidase cbb3-type subunit 3